MLSSSVPTDIDGSKMAPEGSTKETVEFLEKVMFSLGRYLVLMRTEAVLGGFFCSFLVRANGYSLVGVRSLLHHHWKSSILNHLLGVLHIKEPELPVHRRPRGHPVFKRRRSVLEDGFLQTQTGVFNPSHPDT